MSIVDHNSSVLCEELTKSETHRAQIECDKSISMKTTHAILVGTLCTMGCAPLSEPPPLLSETGWTEGRDAFFTALQNADYDSLDHAIELLTREYLDGDLSLIHI